MEEVKSGIDDVSRARVDIGYLFSNPLVIQPDPFVPTKVSVPKLLIHTEMETLNGLFADISRDTHKQIIARYEVATWKRLNELIQLGCRVLHYSGHGKPQ